MTEKQYPELPNVGPIGYASVVDIERYETRLSIGPHLPGVRDVALWTTDQMRAYVDADRAMRAARDAEDAARCRWLAAYCRSIAEHGGGRWSIIVEGPAPKSHTSEDDFYAAINAARAAKEGQNNDQ